MRDRRAREEPRAQVRRPSQPSMLVAAGGFILVCDDVLRSSDLRLAFSQAPEHIEGKE
jgi:hypothetical protein